MQGLGERRADGEERKALSYQSGLFLEETRLGMLERVRPRIFAVLD
jgi:hypothetical protein